jgi:3-phosphoshikimate 1-carboxyvinyltransferase
MDVILHPRVMSGRIAAIPSKSVAHRLLIMAALADRETELILPALSQDIQATMGCLEQMGAEIRKKADRILVEPIRTVPDCAPALDCGESGSTLRFLLPVAAALFERTSFSGHGRLPQRSIEELMEEMERHGVGFSSRHLPFSTEGRLKGGEYRLPGNVSSQYITGLLMALPLLDGPSTLTLSTALESGGYVEITLETLNRFGVKAEVEEGRYLLSGGQTYRSPGQVRVEGDWSNAAFFLALGALSDEITVTGLEPSTAQGDRAVLDCLRAFGAAVEERGGEVTVSPAPLTGGEIDVSPVPDLLPVLAVVAACAQGRTRFYGGRRLRDKESDRLSATARLLTSLGGRAEETPDGLLVTGGGLTGGTVDGCGDHRIVMAGAVAAAVCLKQVRILGAQAVQKSYPAFFEAYEQLGGNVHVL